MKVFKIVQWLKLRMEKMALIGNPLLGSWLNFGQFDAFNPRLTSTRVALNRFIRLIVFINAVKFFIIILAAWLGFPDLKLWLIELYMLEEEFQKYLDVGILMFQLGVHLGYSYWVGLHKKPGVLEGFRFLVIPENAMDRRQYEQRYQLDPESTEKFLAQYRLACVCIKILVAAYLIFIAAVDIRCLLHTFNEVHLVYFLSFSLLFSVVTYLAYLVLSIFVISRLFLMLLSAQFLIYRLKGLNARVCRFTKDELSLGGSKKLRKQRADLFRKASLLRTLHHLNDFCRQFHAINSALDSSISMYLAGLYCFLFIFPYFCVFVDNELSIRLFLSSLAVIAYMFCFSFSICNDRLRRQVGGSYNVAKLY